MALAFRRLELEIVCCRQVRKRSISTSSRTDCILDNNILTVLLLD